MCGLEVEELGGRRCRGRKRRERGEGEGEGGWRDEGGREAAGHQVMQTVSVERARVHTQDERTVGVGVGVWEDGLSSERGLGAWAGARPLLVLAVGQGWAEFGGVS